VTERLAREQSLKSIVTPTPVVSPYKPPKPLEPTPGPVEFRGEPGEDRPPVGYDPAIKTGTTTLKTKSDADKHVRDLTGYNAYLAGLKTHAGKQKTSLQENLEDANRNLVVVLQSSDKYDPEAIRAYQKRVTKYSSDVKASIDSLDKYTENIDSGINTNIENITKIKDWVGSLGIPSTITPTTTTRKGWAVTITDPNTGKKTTETFWSREEMNRYLEYETRGKPIEPTGKGKVQLGDIPTGVADSGIIWDPGFGPTGVEALGPVSEQDKTWFNKFIDSIKNSTIAISLTESREGATRAAQGLKDISDNLKESSGFPTKSERDEIKEQIKSNPWLAYDTEIWDDPPEDATEAVARIGYIATEGFLGVLDELTFPFGRLTKPEDEMDVGLRFAGSLLTPTHWDWIIGSVISELGDVGSNIITKLRGKVRLTPQEIKVVNDAWMKYSDDVYRWTGDPQIKSGDAIDVISESMDDLFGITKNADEISAIADDLAGNKLSDVAKNWDEITPSAYDQQKTVQAMQREIRAMNDFVYGLDPDGIASDTIRHWDVMSTKQKNKFLEDVAKYIDDFYKDPTKLGGAGAGVMAPESILQFETVMTEAGFTPQDAIAAIMRGDTNTFISPDLLTSALLYLQSPLTQKEIQNLGIPDIVKFKQDLTTELKKKIDIDPITDILVVPGVIPAFDDDLDMLPLIDLDVDVVPIVEPIEMPGLADLDVTIEDIDKPIPIPPILDVKIDPVSDIEEPIITPPIPIEEPIPIDPIERQVELLRRRLLREGRGEFVSRETRLLRQKLKKQKARRDKARKILPSKKLEPYQVVFSYSTGASETEWVDANTFHHALNIAQRRRKIKLVPNDVLVEHRPLGPQ